MSPFFSQVLGATQRIHNNTRNESRAQRKAARRRKSDYRDNFRWFKFRSQQHHLVNQSRKLSEVAPKFHLGVSVCAPITFLFVDQSSPSFSSNMGGVVVDQLLFRFSMYGSVPEIFASKFEVVRNRAEF